MKHDPRARVEQAVEHLAHYLPSQGPIGVFVHHNTLHAFEHLPFEEAVLAASRLFGTQPYLSEDRYRQALANGRIQVRDLVAVLASEPNQPLADGVDRRSLRQAMLTPGVREFSPETVEWRLSEGDLASSVREPAAQRLFEACLLRASDPPPTAAADAGRPIDNVVHPFLIRLSANFLDQGAAYWPMPARELGFLAAVRRLVAMPLFFEPAGLPGVSALFRRQVSLDATEVVMANLELLAVDQPEHFVRHELLALPGWAGMFHVLEKEPELAPYLPLPVRLMDYLAVRLTLVAAATAHAPRLPAPPQRPRLEALRLVRAATLFDVCSALNLTSERLHRFDAAHFALFEKEVLACDQLERRRLFHLAYERRHELQILSPLGQFRREQLLAAPPEPARPSAQVFFCIDEREESLRRHLEESAPTVETLGAAGFFGVAMHFAGIDDSLGAAFCPVVVKPAHLVGEQPHPEDEHLYGSRKERRKLWSRLVYNSYISSRSLVRGWVSTGLLGLISLAPLITRILSPRTAGRLRQRLNEAFFPEPRTALAFKRQDHVAGQERFELDLGFTVAEKTERVGHLLRGAGLVNNFARLVVILGHGSESLNNPHESAYNCGACGGRHGGPNARLFAAMANRPGVRAGLRAQGLEIPDDTWFIGGEHDTCSDRIELYELDAVPPTHAADLARLQQQLDTARARNAHERSRRFEHFENSLDPARALMHVEERAEHLAQPRPEYGHSSNAFTFLGRRQSVKGLFFDRRSFLVSYDAALDPDDTYLKRQLGAVVLVCSGIGLEYYFSTVDNEGYGCGTKLPHNITGLLGVMNGQSSDLRTGLTWQMVEIHEPMRPLFIVETTPQRLEAALASNDFNMTLTRHQWIRLATLDPGTGEIHVRRASGWEPFVPEQIATPVAASSLNWYGGKMDHLPVARILPAHRPEAVSR